MLGLTNLGVVHTLISLVPLEACAIAFLRNWSISQLSNGGGV